MVLTQIVTILDVALILMIVVFIFGIVFMLIWAILGKPIELLLSKRKAANTHDS
jgi:F0F1-type ATP synthase membrane subunit b/b'